MALDEQFYLLWPPLLALLGKRNAWLLALAGASLVFRIVWSAHDGPDFVLVLASRFPRFVRPWRGA